MKNLRASAASPLFFCLALLTFTSPNLQGEDFDLMVDDDEILIIEEEEAMALEKDSAAELPIEQHGEEELLIIEEANKSEKLIEQVSENEDILLIGDETDSELLVGDDSDLSVDTDSEERDADDSRVAQTTMNEVGNQDNYRFKIDEIWTEFGLFPDSGSQADSLGLFHSQASFNWLPNDSWEIQLSARLDGYYESGDEGTNRTEADYSDSFIRYTTEQYRLTLGAQTIIWGRIDEFPPTDRMSTQDFSRYILDDLADRRRTNPAVRYEYFSGDSKLDLVVLPFFREPELPEMDSIWFPLNREAGEIIGLKSIPLTRLIIPAAQIDLDEPDSDGGFGLRYSNITPQFDYAITLQNVRQNTPYFAFNPAAFTIQTRYPRSRIIGGDIGFEAMGGAVKLEAAWQGDTPVTEVNGSYSTVDSVTWGAALELFPGDGDARLNLQITGYRLLDAPLVLDRTEVYAFNGTWEKPFDNDRWRLKTRFYFGIGENDIYLNPEIAYTGWSSQELYLEAHVFNGADNTPGGFHEDHSLVAAGWRIRF